MSSHCANYSTLKLCYTIETCRVYVVSMLYYLNDGIEITLDSLNLKLRFKKPSKICLFTLIHKYIFNIFRSDWNFFKSCVVHCGDVIAYWEMAWLIVNRTDCRAGFESSISESVLMGPGTDWRLLQDQHIGKLKQFSISVTYHNIQL